MNSSVWQEVYTRSRRDETHATDTLTCWLRTPYKPPAYLVCIHLWDMKSWGGAQRSSGTDVPPGDSEIYISPYFNLWFVIQPLSSAIYVFWYSFYDADSIVACRPIARQRFWSSQTRAVTRQRHVNSNRGTVFSVGSVPRCYKQDS
jgi:hypothetical protein